MRLSALHIDDQADAAVLMLIYWVIKTLLSW